MATILYVRSTGSDSNSGISTAPLLTAQHAFYVANGGTGDFILDFGSGNFGGVNLSGNQAPFSLPGPQTDWPSRISVRGTGKTTSFLGGIYGSGNAAGDWFNPNWTYYNEDGSVDYSHSGETENYDATNGSNVTIVSDNSINLGDITVDGGGADNAGGDVTLTNCVAGDISTINGGGGLITLVNCTVGTISTGRTCLDPDACGSDYNGGCLYDYYGNGCGVVCTDPTACGSNPASGYICAYDIGYGCFVLFRDCSTFVVAGDQSSYLETNPIVIDPNLNSCLTSSLDALGYCCGTCNDSNACGEDNNGCLYDNGCGCGNPDYPGCNGCGTETDSCDNCVSLGAGCYSSCAYGICGCSDLYNCGCQSDGSSNTADVFNLCGGNCFDSNADGHDLFGNCCYNDCAGNC